jgi:hypothetical protein
MYKLATFLTLLLMASLISVTLIDFHSNDSLTAWADDKKVEDKLTSYKCFKQALESTLDELGKGGISSRRSASVLPCSASMRWVKNTISSSIFKVWRNSIRPFAHVCLICGPSCSLCLRSFSPHKPEGQAKKLLRICET